MSKEWQLIPVQENPVAKKFMDIGERLPLLARGETLFAEGDQGGNMYFLRSGGLALQTAIAGNLFTVDIAGPGTIFGWDAFISTPYSTTAIAELASSIVSVPVDKINELLQGDKNFEIGKEFGELLAREIRRANAVGELCKMGNAKQNAAQALLVYGNFLDVKDAIAGTQEEMAQYAGVARGTFSDYLSSLEKRGLIGRDVVPTTNNGGKIQILDANGLEKKVKRG
jgi:CRP-like cAMP-binding protein